MVLFFRLFSCFSVLFRVLPHQILAPCSAILPEVRGSELLLTFGQKALQGARILSLFSRFSRVFLVFSAVSLADSGGPTHQFEQKVSKGVF